MPTRSTLRSMGLALVLALAASVATAAAPTQVPFQGLLLDAGGDPVNAAVDLDFELFDALSAGTSLWSESHMGVTVVDGVYSVNLGETTPLTDSVLGGGVAFLEIAVDGETLVPRQQLLAVPYAQVAARAETVGGAPAIFVEQLMASFSVDGQEPPNTHPDEGFGDSDGDGIPNFIDPDNDNDGILDGEEFLAGSSLNVVTPTITGVAPSPVRSFFETTLVVSGTNLETVASASFGAEASTPENVTSNSFELPVSAETLAATETLAITIANGESASSVPVAIQAVAPTITSSPIFVPAGQVNEVTITGTGFYPGTTVQVGTQNLVPSALTDTSLTVTMAPEPVSSLPLVVTHPNTLTDTSTLTLEVTPPNGTRTVFVTNGPYPVATIGSVAGANAICQSAAAADGLPAGTYRAWISDGMTSPATSFNQAVGPYVLPNGTVIATSWSDLTDGSLLAPISITANGSPNASAAAWTGTNADGTASGAGASSSNCGGWANPGTTGVRGSTGDTDGDWSNQASGVNCSLSLRLYCFQL